MSFVRQEGQGTGVFFSVVIPTYSRPDEVGELLASLNQQTYKSFEVIIIDASPDDSVRRVVERYTSLLSVKYFYHKGLGISESRNLGVANAVGKYLVFFDSDCLIPEGYFSTVYGFLYENPTDAWGGPDKAHEDFTLRQKAISYAMTSLFTTGGIRGRKTHAGKYQPRTFNMGTRRDVFNALGGFSGLKVSEDIDLSIRLYERGYTINLIENAFVYHKRRNTFYKFFWQVFSFGSSRIDLQIRHGSSLKPVHVLPSLSVLYVLAGLAAVFMPKGIFWAWLAPILVYCLVIMVDSTVQNKSLVVGLLSLYASLVMLAGYGTGMLKAVIFRYFLRSKSESKKPEITRES